jgi:hypothetical protein
MRCVQRSTVLAASLVLLGGCGDGGGAKTPTSAAVDGARYLLQAEPDGAQPVVAAREQAQDGAEIVLLGRIGGSADPWIEGRAAFSVVDPVVTACTQIPGDSCPTPWDYCCRTDELPKAKALVKIVDERGALVEEDARKLLALRELQTVVVRGKAKRDEAGNLTVLATGLFVRPDSAGPAASGTGRYHQHDHFHDHDRQHDPDRKPGAQDGGDHQPERKPSKT